MSREQTFVTVLRDGERFWIEEQGGRDVFVFGRVLSDGKEYVVADHTMDALTPEIRDAAFRRAEAGIE